MTSSYLLIALRTMFKHKAAFLINLIGMSIALGCCITAFVNYQYNEQFDREQTNAENIYRVGFWEESEGKQTPYGVCPIPVGNLLSQNLAEDEAIIQYISKEAQFRIGDEMFQRQFVYTEPGFTKAFNIDLLSGAFNLNDKSKVLISDKLAITYFGEVNVVGKPLTQIISGEPREFEIGGVFKEFPANSSFRFDLLTSYSNYFSDESQQAVVENDWSRWATTFLYTKNPATVNALNKQLEQYIAPQNEARRDLLVKSYYIESFVGMSARAIKERNQGHWMNGPMPPAAVVAPFVMAAFLLLVACFNYMNNSIALAANRLKEIGIRKAIGGKRKELIIQFLSETMVFCTMALLLALVLAEYFTQGWNNMWNGIEIKLMYADNLQLFIALALLMAITAVTAGGYSAFFISSFKPIQILRGTLRFSGSGWVSKSLLVVQFSISLAAVIFALAFYFNSKFQKSYDLGYNYRSVIQVPLDNPDQYEKLKIELATNPQIASIGGSEHHIYYNSSKASARNEKQDELQIDVLNVGDNYFQTVNVRLQSGRLFGEEQASDYKESIVVNEEFIRRFNLEEQPLGSRILLNDSIPVYVIGVVKDVYLRALFQPLTPVAFRYVPKSDYKFLIASTAPEQLASVNDQIKAEWQKLFPNMLYTGRLMEQNMAMVMEHFDSVVILYTFLGLVAIVMSVSGLYSLVSLSLQKRTKEFGIRKILGAPVNNIVLHASKSFMLIMFIAFILGSLMGTWYVNKLMDSVWEYYEAINAGLLTIAISILLTIALATIGTMITRVAWANPVDSLRYE